MARIPTETIRAGLIGRVRELLDQLAPDAAHIRGNDRWSLNPTRPDRHPDSFKVDISGPNAGRWKDFATGEGGDLIDLIAYCRFPGHGHYQSREARGAAIQWAKVWLGLDTARPEDLRKADEAAAKRRAAIERQRQQEAAQEGRKAARSRAQWLAAPVSAWDHPVSKRYLTEVREIDPDQLTHVGGGMKFEPDGAPWASAPADDQGRKFPAIVTCMVRLNAGRDAIRALHRTYLAHDGSGKAAMKQNPKVVYGAALGCAIRLTKGSGNLSPEEAVRRGVTGETLAISEGIEDGLTWAMIEPEHRVWAAGSLSYLGAIEVPACTGRLMIVRQNDTKQAAREAFDREVAKLIARTGLEAEMAAPPPPFKDWNDWWRGSDA